MRDHHGEGTERRYLHLNKLTIRDFQMPVGQKAAKAKPRRARLVGRLVSFFFELQGGLDCGRWNVEVGDGLHFLVFVPACHEGS